MTGLAPGRWSYEVQNLTKLVLAEDYAAIYKRLDITLESSSKKAGILFPGD